MSTDLLSIGMNFERWQDAVEAAIATEQLQVKGEVRGGQLVQFTDASGAQINILAVEPFATFAGFSSVSRAFADVTMLNDVLALCEISDAAGNEIAAVTANLSQGPLLVDEGRLEFQPISFTALGMDIQLYSDAVSYENATGGVLGMAFSESAQLVDIGSGAKELNASLDFSAQVLEAEYRRNALTGCRFIHATVDGLFPFDVCIPDTISAELPAPGSVIVGRAVLAANLLAYSGGGGCGGSCACGSGGCGGH
ncbi:hypothetical protein [Corynebacterium caspium]|uniref:hypothetical protein n=1 Tax=Corynebacterium caspium TaxID=234828 RepID=UPI0004776817|nr:hypothetical protein [Corynebacterium caspium]WKD59121.1 hypothetical protein CCASP_03585 [Corynebacterium caspium DSM 44850]